VKTLPTSSVERKLIRRKGRLKRSDLSGKVIGENNV